MTMLQTIRPARISRSLVTGMAALAAGMVVWTTTTIAAVPGEGYADLVDKVSPAVVYISSNHTAAETRGPRRGQERERFRSPFPPGSPFDEFFRRYQQETPDRERPVTAMGSGFIIDAGGDVVTNNHVVDGASTVKVRLQDGGEFIAKVVGTDARTDLALLKVNTDKPLPYVSFGDSGKLRVGDVVLAVGNPFGLGGTVTAGIVSARSRDINAGPYDDFIQTDASINPGNSGGPLFSTRGEVVGVNTAIYSPNGGSVGIGFAIPSSLAKSVVSQIKETGKVERGWLGVKIQAVTPDIAKALGLDEPKGALVAEVTADSPAAKAGIGQGDVIIAYAGKEVATVRDLPRLVGNTSAGETVKINFRRGGETRSATVKIGVLKPDVVASTDEGRVAPGHAVSKTLGVELATLDDDTKAQLNLGDGVTGVLVADVDPAGRAAAGGLRQGDVIEKVGSAAVTTPSEVEALVAKAKTKAVMFLVNRGGNRLFVGVKLHDA